MYNLSIFYSIIVGLASGAILASTGAIGPFLIPALLFLGFPSSLARGTCLMSELLMTLVSLVLYERTENLDKRVILAYLPGLITVALGAIWSVNFPELLMKWAIGVFQIIIGLAMTITTLKWSDEQDSKNVFDNNAMFRLGIIALFAGFAKGFFGAGWGPIGIGLFVLLKIDPRIAVGSSLVVRLILDCVGGFTYVGMNLVDYNAVMYLTVPGSFAAFITYKLTKGASSKTLKRYLGLMTMILGALIIA